MQCECCANSLFYLGNNDKEKQSLCTVTTVFLVPNIFEPGSVKSMVGWMCLCGAHRNGAPAIFSQSFTSLTFFLNMIKILVFPEHTRSFRCLSDSELSLQNPQDATQKSPVFKSFEHHVIEFNHFLPCVYSAFSSSLCNNIHRWYYYIIIHLPSSLTSPYKWDASFHYHPAQWL